MISTQNLRDFAVGIGFIVLQIMLFRHLKFYGMQADVVLVYALWIIATRERTTALILVALVSFLQDALLDLWGLHMFAKTLMTFIIYNFVPRLGDTRLLIGQIFLTVLIAALIHNIIFLTVGGLIESYSTDVYFWRQWFGNALYTGLAGSIIYLFYTD